MLQIKRFGQYVITIIRVPAYCVIEEVVVAVRNRRPGRSREREVGVGIMRGRGISLIISVSQEKDGRAFRKVNAVVNPSAHVLRRAEDIANK